MSSGPSSSSAPSAPLASSSSSAAASSSSQAAAPGSSSSGKPPSDPAAAASQAAPTAAEGEAATPQAAASSLDVSLLPLLYSILSTVEKEHLAGADANQKNKDSLEASQKIAELNEKIARIRSDVYGLPGIGKSPKEQKNQLRSLRKQLEMKKKLIAKYKAINLKVSGLSGSHIAASAGPVSSATVPMTH